MGKNQNVAIEALDKSTEIWRVTKAFFISLFQEFFNTGCQKSAAALTYMTLFAIVPALTVIFTVFSAIPAFDGLAVDLQTVIFSHFLPESSKDLQSYLTSFSSQARNLTFFGVAMLVVTAYLMLVNIEKTFNAIWGVHQARRGLSSFLIYWAVLSIGPVLLGAALFMSTYLLSIRLFLDEFDDLGLTATLFKVTPFFMTSGAFTLLFVAVPNCKVPLKFAAIGGLITAACIEALKAIFSKIVSNSSFELIYGAFAVVPLFLIWVNLAWTVILSGAILVRTLAEHRYITRSERGLNLVMALRCLRRFYQQAQAGGKVADDDCYRLGMGVSQWQTFRSKLIEKNVIAETSSGHYVLCRDLNNLLLWDLADIVELRVFDLARPVPPELKADWMAEYLERRERIALKTKEELSVSVGHLIGTSDRNSSVYDGNP